MKRKETELETQLVASGWYLTHKNYKGRLAKRIDSYVYERDFNGFHFRLYLNPKRNEIRELKIENHYYYAGLYELSLLSETYEDLSNELKCLCNLANTLVESSENE